jgi:hypothetical protein
MKTNKTEDTAIYDEMLNYILSSGIQEKNVSREINANSGESEIYRSICKTLNKYH